MEVGQAFICAMYGQRRGTTVGEARFPTVHSELWQASQSNMTPPLTIFFHMMRAHLQTILAKSADMQTPHLNVTSNRLGGRSKMASQYRPHTTKPLQVHYVRRLLEAQMALTLDTDI